MGERRLTAERIAAYGRYLRMEERAAGTLEKYLRDIRRFAAWLDGRPVTKELAVAWKEYLLVQQYAPATINGMLAALNGLLSFLGWNECGVKPLKRQRSVFRSGERELTRPAGGGPADGEGTAVPGDGDALLHGNAGFGAAVHHCGNTGTGLCSSGLQGQTADCSAD